MKYFTYKEFNCSCCDENSGKENMNKEFLLFLDKLRENCSFSFKITSGFRCKNKQQSLVDNPKYKATSPDKSSHCKGLAADIAITTDEKRALFVGYGMELATELDLPVRIGISKKQGFCHIDVDTSKNSPRLWIYS